LVADFAPPPLRQLPIGINLSKGASGIPVAATVHEA
jgi:hypothetical protein